MPRVVVNSTPLIILSNINQLDLLKKLYSEIYIPEAVFNEVTEKQTPPAIKLKVIRTGFMYARSLMKAKRECIRQNCMQVKLR